MNIKEFADTHDQQIGTVVMYIRRHKDLFNDHIEKVGNNTELDDEAIRLLELQYPLPKPIQVVENTETQQKYINALEHINYLQNEMLNIQKELNKYQSLKFLLDKKEKDFDELSSKYEKLKNRGLWDRIINKD